MPTYDYRCDRGHVFEVFHGIKDDSARTCPRCGKPARRVPSGGAGLLFRGSGFYITDYRSSSYKRGAQAERGKSAGGEPGPRGGESKPAGGSKPGGSE
jgi:putative FmdB family regulatory protein